MKKPKKAGPRTLRAALAAVETFDRSHPAASTLEPESEIPEGEILHIRAMCGMLEAAKHPTSVLIIDLGTSDPEETGDIIGTVQIAVAEALERFFKDKEGDERSVLGGMYVPEHGDG